MKKPHKIMINNHIRQLWLSIQKTGNKSWPGKENIAPRTLRFSNHVVKAGMKTTGKRSPAARGRIVNRTRNTSEITEDNTEKQNRKRSPNIGADTTPRIRSRSKQRKIGQNIARFEAWEQESESIIALKNKKLWDKITDSNLITALDDLLPSKRTMVTLRQRRHNYIIPLVRTERFKRTFITRCLLL